MTEPSPSNGTECVLTANPQHIGCLPIPSQGEEDSTALFQQHLRSIENVLKTRAEIVQSENAHLAEQLADLNNRVSNVCDFLLVGFGM